MNQNIPITSHDLDLMEFDDGRGGTRGWLHRRVDDQTPIADLFVGIARSMGVEINQFGDSQGILDPRA